MKKINLFLVAALTLFSLAALADSTSGKQTAPTLANQTATIAKSTLGVAQDTAITTYIYAKLASHPNLSNTNLDISTNEGKVVLNGIVNNDSQAKEIRQIAESTSGVKSVDSSKMLIGQQDSALYVKTSAASPPTTPKIEESTLSEVETVAQPEMQPSSADPILTNPGVKLASNSESTARMEKQTKVEPLPKTTHKARSHAASKHKKKKTADPVKARKHNHKMKKSPPHKQALIHHKKNKVKALVKRHPKLSAKHYVKLKHPSEKLKKSPVVSHKSTNESVDQMTSNFLKTALMANKAIPEE